MSRIRHFSCIAALLVLALPASAETLDDVLARTLAGNPQIKSGEASADIAHYGAIEARAKMLPSVTANYRSERLLDSKTGSNVLGVSARQLLFNGGSAVKGYKRSKAEAKGARERLRGTEQRLMQAAASIYTKAARDLEVLRLRAAYVREVQKLLRATQRRLEQGEGTRTDVDRVKTQLFEAEAQLSSAQAAFEQSVAQLEQVAGITVSSFSVGPFPAALIPASEQEILNLALLQNASIAEAREKLKAARYGVWAETAAFGPALYASADYAREYDGSFKSPVDETKLALELTIPLSTGGRGYARYKSSRALEQQRSYDFNAQQAEVVQVVKSGSRAFRGSRLRMDASRRAVNSAMDTFRGMTIEFDQGERSLSDVIDARRALVDRQVELEIAKQAYWEAGIGLLAVMGQLSPGSFHSHAPNPQLVPKQAVFSQEDNDIEMTNLLAAPKTLKPAPVAANKPVPIISKAKAVVTQTVSRKEPAKRKSAVKPKPEQPTPVLRSSFE